MGGDRVKKMFSKPIQLADQVTNSVDDAKSFKQDCLELKPKTEKLAALLRQAAQDSSNLYKRPTLRIIKDTEKILYKPLSLVKICRFRANGCLMKRLFTMIEPATTFEKLSTQLQILIGDVSWLLRVSVYSKECAVISPIAQNEFILCLIREPIDTLCKGSLDDDRSDAAAASLVCFARDHDHFRKLIIKEGGVGPLLKLVIEGTMEGQESAAQAIGFLGRDPKSVQHLIHAGVCSVFEKILTEEDGPMKVQSMVAWAVSEFAANHPKCQYDFAQYNIIRLLVSHLSFETVNREYEDPATKASMKAMAAKALWHLAQGNPTICRSITESGALLYFAVLLEETDEEVQYNSAMALMEIAAVAEEDAELRWSAFQPSTPGAKAVFDQFLRIFYQSDSDHLVPCIMAMGFLARTFQVTETRIIRELVKLLDHREELVSRAATIALSKFVCTGNSLHLNHSKAIINEGGAILLIQHVYFGAPLVRIPALTVLSYITLHVPDSKELAKEEVLKALEWASKECCLISDPTVHTLLPEAKSRLELSQSEKKYMIH